MHMVPLVSLDWFFHDALKVDIGGNSILRLVTEDELFLIGEEGQGIVIGVEVISEEHISQIVGCGPVIKGLLDTRSEQLFFIVGGR